MTDVFVSGTRWGAFTVARYEVPTLIEAFQRFYYEQVRQPDKWGSVLAHIPSKGVKTTSIILAYDKEKKHYPLSSLVCSGDPVIEIRGIAILRYQNPSPLVSAYCGYAIFQQGQLVSVCTLLIEENLCPKHGERFGQYKEK